MAIVKEIKYKNATITINEKCCKTVTADEGAKILEKMMNDTSIVRNSRDMSQLPTKA